jgi:hypothetical protein
LVFLRQARAEPFGSDDGSSLIISQGTPIWSICAAVTRTLVHESELAACIVMR